MTFRYDKLWRKLTIIYSKSNIESFVSIEAKDKDLDREAIVVTSLAELHVKPKRKTRSKGVGQF